MISELDETQIIQVITTIVMRHGCRIVEMDLKHQILNIDGPAEARVACAEELAAFLD